MRLANNTRFVLIAEGSTPPKGPPIVNAKRSKPESEGEERDSLIVEIPEVKV